MKTDLLIKNFTAGAAIAPYRIVKFGSGDGVAVQSAADSDALIGVSDELGGADGARVDIVTHGIAQVLFGGTVVRGQLLTSDSLGRAVAASDGTRSIGMAMASGVSGDIGYVYLNPGRAHFGSSVTTSAAELNVLDNAPANGVFTIGAETANVINVSVQLRNADNQNLATRRHILAYLSGASSGASLATAPSGGVAIGTEGLLIEPVDNRAFRVLTNASGVFDINITDTGTPTMHLVLVFPNGSIQVSTAITFA